MRLFGNINRLFTKVTGSTAEFPLETRIFHSLCILAIIALGYNVPFNYLIGLPLVASLSLVTLILFSFLFYRSRYRGKVKSSVVIFAISGQILFAANFVFNSGTYGPTDMLMGLSMLFVLCVAPRNQQREWVLFNISIILILHLVEYYHPAWIPDSYQNRESRYFDITSGYVVMVMVLYYAMTYLKRNYEYEKRSALEKSAAIEIKNKQITEQNQELERINSERNKLMSIIAHDLRSPLSNIQNYLELVTEFELNTIERQMVEEDLLKVTRRTIDMLGKLLVWSKGQMDGVSVKLGYVSLRDALFNTFELEKSIASKKQIILDSEIEWDTRLIADNDMLQLVVRNLINNAIKFTPRGGHISFKAKQSSHECLLTISDNGIGIPAKKQTELFSLQVAATFGTDNEKGVGLGLLLCKEFTELQGGRIWLESTEGLGTTFYIALPAGH